MTEKDIVFDTTLSNRQKYHQIFGEWVDRKKAWREIIKLQAVYRGDVQTYKTVVSPKTSVNIFADEAQESSKLLDCAEEDLKNPKFLLEAHGYDTKVFKLVSAQSSIWQQNSTEKGMRELYASKIKVAPFRAEEQIVSIVQEFLQHVKSLKLNRPVKAMEKAPAQMLEIVFTDLHVGLISRIAETGKEYSNVTLQYNIDNILAEITGILRSFVESGVCIDVTLVFLGDLLHYDTAHKTTTKGTIQESNNSFQEDYECALSVLNKIFNTVIGESNGFVDVIYIPGNHDEIIGYTLLKTMEALYSNKDEQITFNVDQKSRKFVLFHNVLIGYMHGKMDKSRISKWLYSEAKPFISNANTIEIHAGHRHCEDVIEDNGLKVRHLPTITGRDTWEYNQGYNSKRTMQLFLWDENHLIGIRYINDIRH